jgi:hypothetical protein
MLGYYALAPVPGMPAVSVGERHRVYKRSAKGHRLTAGLTTVACLRRSHTCTSANTSEVGKHSCYNPGVRVFMFPQADKALVSKHASTSCFALASIMLKGEKI